MGRAMAQTVILMGLATTLVCAHLVLLMCIRAMNVAFVYGVFDFMLLVGDGVPEGMIRVMMF